MNISVNPDTNNYTYVLVSPPSHGTIIFNSDGTYTYNPNLNFDGPDSFTYKAIDGLIESNITNINIISDSCFTFDTLTKIKINFPVIILKSKLLNKKIYKVGNYEMTDNHPILHNNKMIKWGKYAKKNSGTVVNNVDYIYNIVGHSIQNYEDNIFDIGEKENFKIFGGKLSDELLCKLNKKIKILNNLSKINEKYISNHIIYDLNEIKKKEIKNNEDVGIFIYVPN